MYADKQSRKSQDADAAKYEGSKYQCTLYILLHTTDIWPIRISVIFVYQKLCFLQIGFDIPLLITVLVKKFQPLGMTNDNSLVNFGTL